MEKLVIIKFKWLFLCIIYEFNNNRFRYRLEIDRVYPQIVSIGCISYSKMQFSYSIIFIFINKNLDRLITNPSYINCGFLILFYLNNFIRVFMFRSKLVITNQQLLFYLCKSDWWKIYYFTHKNNLKLIYFRVNLLILNVCIYKVDGYFFVVLTTYLLALKFEG